MQKDLTNAIIHFPSVFVLMVSNFLLKKKKIVSNFEQSYSVLLGGDF